MKYVNVATTITSNTDIGARLEPTALGREFLRHWSEVPGGVTLSLYPTYETTFVTTVKTATNASIMNGLQNYMNVRQYLARAGWDKSTSTRTRWDSSTRRYIYTSNNWTAQGNKYCSNSIYRGYVSLAQCKSTDKYSTEAGVTSFNPVDQYTSTNPTAAYGVYWSTTGGSERACFICTSASSFYTTSDSTSRLGGTLHYERVL